MTHRRARHAAGLRPHTGWVAVVVLNDELELVDRRRVPLLDAALPRQVFHSMQGLDLTEIAALLADVRASAAAAAYALVDDLASKGALAGIGVVAWQPSVPGDTEDVLRSHQLMHAAEGDLYRGALLEAAASRGVAVESFLPANLAATVASVAGLDLGDVLQRLAMLGKRCGPPWQKDQKEATLAAWATLQLMRRPRAEGSSPRLGGAAATSSPDAPEAVPGHRRR